MKYTWLFFDADGTLFDYEAAEVNALKATLIEFQIPYRDEYQTIYKEINTRLWKKFEEGGITSEKLRVQRFEELLQAIQVSADPEKISQSYLPNLALGIDLIDGALETLQALAPLYQFALITNGLSSVQRPRLAASKLANMFQIVIISEEIQAAKPDPRYFQEALSQANKPPLDQVLIIGDSLSSDIRGANLSNIDACWFNPGGQTLPAGFHAQYQISRLVELLSILG